jgi:tetratricopeptide (TPR) repeat protein
MAELVAIAGRPIPQEVAAAAAHIEPAEFNRRAATLRVSNLVRTGGARWADAIEPYHDRVREAVFAQLGAERKRALHEALAIAFEASSHHDPETLATHWREAGNSARAARYAAAAGDQVSKAFAFDRAAQWYEQALELIPAGDPSRRELRISLGHALANAGRGALAAPHFEAAAAESPPMEALELRRRAADQLLRSGRVDEGLEASRQVLASIGLRFPRTRFTAMVTAVFYRLYLAARGLGFRQRERAQVTAEELARIDTCMMLAYALSLIDPLLGVMFQTRALILALRAGELERVTRSVCVEAAFSGQSGRPAWPRTERLLDYANELAGRSGSLEARFYAACGAGAALYCNARCMDALPQLELSLELGQDGSTGFVHEQVIAQFFLTNVVALLGRFKELRRRQSDWLREAIARGDTYGSVLMRTGNANLVWLMEDRPDVAEEQAVAAIGEWSKGGFHVAHNNGLLARIHAKLYRDDAGGADALARELCERARASSLWRVQITRLRALQQSCSAALLMLQHGLGDRTALLARAAHDAREIEREGTPWSLPLSTLVRAGIALHSGSRSEAMAGLDAAGRAYEAIGMTGFALATRDRVARLRDDATTAGDIERAVAYLRNEGVAAPARFIAMLVPGLVATAPGRAG